MRMMSPSAASTSRAVTSGSAGTATNSHPWASGISSMLSMEPPIFLTVFSDLLEGATEFGWPVSLRELCGLPFLREPRREREHDNKKPEPSGEPHQSVLRRTSTERDALMPRQATHV